MTIDHEYVLPAILIHIQEAGSPAQESGVSSKASRIRDIRKGTVPVVVIKGRGIVGKIGFHNIEEPIAIVIGRRNTHTGLFLAVLVEGGAGNQTDISKGPVPLVVIEDIGSGVACHIDVGPAVVIVVRNQSGKRIVTA